MSRDSFEQNKRLSNNLKKTNFKLGGCFDKDILYSTSKLQGSRDGLTTSKYSGPNDSLINRDLGATSVDPHSPNKMNNFTQELKKNIQCKTFILILSKSFLL